MSARKRIPKAKQLKAKRVELKDLTPKARAAEQLKGGPQGNPWAGIRGKRA